MTIFMETTTVSAERTIAEIQTLLVKYGATAVLAEYVAGAVTAVSFKYPMPGGDIGFSLPCKWDRIVALLKREGRNPRRGESYETFGRRVAWRQIYHWIKAQLALVETAMVKLDEVFLPYMQVGPRGETAYQMLGQAVFGCPSGEFECPGFIEAGLRQLADEIKRVEWNRTQKAYDAPTENVAGEYHTPAFRMHSYYWGDDEVLSNRPNFKCGEFEVRWYKYLGRGMSMNRAIDANAFFALIEKSLASVRKRDVKP